MPEPVELDLTPLDELRRFQADSAEMGGLLSASDVARLLGIHDATVRNYMLRGRVEFVEHFGRRWITGREVERRLVAPRGPGRPRARFRV